MTNGNHDPEKPRKKKCPLLNDWCIGDACALQAQLIRVQGGLQQKMEVCAFNATVMMLTEISVKLQQPPQQKIQLPGIFRG